MQSNSNWLIINKFLIWCEITKPLSGPVVQFFFNPGNKLIGYSTEVRSFGDVLPDETVHILIGSTFPRMVRFTKIETNFQFFRYFLMFCKFFSIVCRYCMYHAYQRRGAEEALQIVMAQCDNWAENEDNFVEHPMKYYQLEASSDFCGMVAEEEIRYQRKE